MAAPWLMAAVLLLVAVHAHAAPLDPGVQNFTMLQRGSPGQAERYGSSLALSVTGLLVVGAPERSTSGYYTGEGVIFMHSCELNGGFPTCGPGVMYTEPDSQLGNRFGKSVAVAGNLVVVGTPQRNRVRLSWCTSPSSCSAGIELSNNQASTNYGGSVQIIRAGPVGANYYILAVGASNDKMVSGASFSVGKVYIYSCVSHLLCSSATVLTPVNTTVMGNFGEKISLWHNVTAGDGDVIVAVSGTSSNMYSGEVTLFHCSAPFAGPPPECSGPSLLALTQPAQTYAAFGRSLVFHDGFVAIGATGRLVNGVNTGSVFVAHCPTITTCSPTRELQVEGNGVGGSAQVGASIALADDGVLVVGVPGYMVDGIFQGAALLYDCDPASEPGSPPTCSRGVRLQHPNGYGGDHFGTDMVYNAGMLVVSAPGVNENSGTAFVFGGVCGAGKLGGMCEGSCSRGCEPDTCDDLLRGNGTGVCSCRTGWQGSLCDTCAPGWQLDTLTGECVCAAGHYGPQCDACMDCGHGTCNDGLLGDGTCVCQSKWVHDASGSCLQCASGRFGPTCELCDGCNDHGTCNEGVAGDGSCACDTGFDPATRCASCRGNYLFNPSLSVCEACHPSCATCTEPGVDTACLSCVGNLTLTDEGACICGETCNITCWDTCETCHGNGINQCLTCAEHAPLFQEGACVAECELGFFQSGATTCDACSSSCAGCSGPLATNCTACSGSLVLVGSTCQTSCPPGTYQSGPNTCAPCDDTCSTCSSATMCTACAGSRVLLGGECLAACPDGLYATAQQTCQLCRPSCATCDQAITDVCLTCAGSLLRAPSGQCVNECGYGYYARTDDRVCAACDASCLLCDGGTAHNCTSCVLGRLLEEGVCVSQCSDGYFVQGGQCTRCDPQCATCSGSASQCTACADPDAVVLAGACVAACPGGTYVGPQRVCTACPIGCSQCANATTCTECNDGSKLFDGACVAACPVGHYSIEGQGRCGTCHASCALCSGPSDSDCTGCGEESFTLNGGRCVAVTASSQMSDTASIVVAGVAVPLALFLFLMARWRSPNARNSALLTVVMGLADVLTDAIFVAAQFGKSDSLADASIIAWASLAFVAVPVLVNWIVAISLLPRISRDDPKWMSNSTAVAAAMVMLAGSQLEVLQVLHSRVFNLAVFSANWAEETVALVKYLGLISLCLEDIPQLIIQITVISNDAVDAVTVIAIATSILMITFHVLERAMTYTARRATIQFEMATLARAQLEAEEARARSSTTSQLPISDEPAPPYEAAADSKPDASDAPAADSDPASAASSSDAQPPV